MMTEFMTYMPILAKVSLKGNSTIYITFLIAVLAAAAPTVFLWKSLFTGDEKLVENRIWSATFFLFGLLLVVAGMFVYWIFGEYGRPTAIVHGVGVGFILAMLLVGRYEGSGLLTGQTAFFSGVTLFFVAAALGLVVGVNVLGVRKSKKFDFNKTKLQSLDNQTVNKLKALKDPIRVVVFVTKQDRNAVPGIKSFFEKYESVNRKMFKIQFVNPLKEPEIASCFEVKESGGNKRLPPMLIARGRCVAKSGKGGGQTFKGKKYRITQLKEEHVTNRMIRVSRMKEKEVCFLTGRNQPSITGQPTNFGFQFLKKYLENKGFKSSSVNLLETDEVPKKCSIVINAAPELLSVRRGNLAHHAKLSAQEVTKIERYLDKGGKMLLFLEPVLDTGLGGLLKKKFGIEWKPGIVLDFVKNVGPPVRFTVVKFDTRHQITKRFSKVKSVRAYNWYASALKKSGSVAGVSLTTLASATQRQFAGYRIDPKTRRRVKVKIPGKCCSFYIPKPGSMRFRFLQREYTKLRPQYMFRKALSGFVERIIPNAKRGEFPVAMAASKKSAKAGKETRVVVFSDTFPATNKGHAFQGYANITMVLNSVAWLAHEKDLIALPPKNRKVKKLALTAISRATIEYSTRYGMPVIFFFVILLVSAIRRQK